MDNKALYNIGYGLYVLTAQNNGKQNGCIINTVMQITSNPVCVVIGVNKETLTHDMVMDSKKFNLSVLTEDTPFSVFQTFGYNSGRTLDKFAAFFDFEKADNGIYFINKNVNSLLQCEVTETSDMGTHTLFKANIVDAVVFNKLPSVTYTYYQKNIKPKLKSTALHGFRCNICAYEHISDTLPDDFICPICKHGASDFVKF